MRLAKMGSGAIGGYLGARLVQADEDVAFIARGPHLEAMRRHGLQLESPLGNITLPQVTVSETPADLGLVDIVVFAVKLYDIEKAAAAIIPLVGPETRILTLQNGIDSIDTLARFAPRSQIVGGAAYVSVHLQKPGLVVHRGGVTLFTVGGRGDAMMEVLRGACSRAVGVELQTIGDVDQVLWTKFVTLCAFSGATSLMRAGIGPILADPESRIFIEQLLEEGMAVASAAGHPMAEGHAEHAMSLWRTFPPETQASMAIDFSRGRPTELAWLSGRLRTLGNELGVPTPAHTAVYRALHLHAEGSELLRRPRLEALEREV
ncbi:MAG: 2-dehydropantoate 2-reductase [Mesorhizobium sp.]|uniref:ketopantoate reductase family protein n=1 Tax=Mesorhizobium sp. TaxID=1871066 RepID=UPI000FE6895C|nr:2-dehydropantoate 2-reductase [Mesorhizobium sp.]RWP47976.1 MAG: 2-dehydropantoate 2-reductase [Mesorhizobium sp.]RWQ34203.1 MAG: 2-dehydropantoate 2-reductase [Mesorhizobium sp.]TIL22381.1 MAG: 2-dehydropantoate 2-reductase [Mesorhizobium sp.]